MKPSLNRVAGAALAASLTMSGVAQAADVVIGVPNWPSVRVTAHVLKVVMEDNLGLEVELQNGTNPVVFEAMDAGAMHVHPEVWMPNQVNLHETYVKGKKTVRMNPNGIPAFQGMCVTKSTAERTGIVNLSDLTNPIWPQSLIRTATAKVRFGLVLLVGHRPMSKKFVRSHMVMLRP